MAHTGHTVPFDLVCLSQRVRHPKQFGVGEDLVVLPDHAERVVVVRSEDAPELRPDLLTC